MARVIVQIDNGRGRVENFYQDYNPMTDAKVYARLARLAVARREAYEADKPLSRAKKEYRDLLAAGLVEKGQVITNAESKELLAKLSMMNEPQYLF